MIRGVVLCGGESKRMGSDKGLLPIGLCTWSQHAARKLKNLNVAVVISVNITQLSAYCQFFPPELLVTDQVAAKGPLTGLLSVHLNFPDDDLLLLACDMTEMDLVTLQQLNDIATAFPGFDYYVYIHENFMEPLCAVYTAGALKKLHYDLENGSLPNFSLHKLIKRGNYKALSIPDIKNFSNHNTATI